jgi:hypothetical protein
MSAQAELVVPDDPEQREKYEARDLTSVYHSAQYQYPIALWHGIYRRGRFPEVAVRAALMAKGFSVLISDPEMPNGGGFMLTHYTGKRRARHPAFLRMFRWFPEERVVELNRQCDALKKQLSGNAGGGDPDLFVYSTDGDRFFVEVKDDDELIKKQRATFPKIARILNCDVLVARVRAVSRAAPGDGITLVSRPANKTSGIDAILDRVVTRLAEPGYAPTYRTELDFEVDVWRRLVPLAQQLGFDCLTSHKVHSGRPTEEWKRFCSEPAGPDVRTLGVHSRLDIVLRNRHTGSIGIEVKCLGKHGHVGKLTQGLGQAILGLANRDHTVLLIHCGTAGQAERVELRGIGKRVCDGSRIRLVVVP